MNTDSKLMLSDDELQLVTNSNWILTKRAIMEKVDGLLGELSEKQKHILENEKHWLPAEVVRSEPKISRGENYLQLPYLLLDHPRCFYAENIFAVRTMFWWGNFFSVTLQLSGEYKEKFQEKIIEHINPGVQDMFICINESQWQHHFETDNYINLNGMNRDDLQDVIEKKQFIKLAMKFPLQPWDALTALLENSFLEMIKLLKH